MKSVCSTLNSYEYSLFLLAFLPMSKSEKHFWNITIDKNDKFIIWVGYKIHFAFEAYVLCTYLMNFSFYIAEDTTYPL